MRILLIIIDWDESHELLILIIRKIIRKIRLIRLNPLLENLPVIDSCGERY